MPSGTRDLRRLGLTLTFLILLITEIVSAAEIVDRQLAVKAIQHSDYGLRYLRSKQANDGSWADSTLHTALALRAFLESYQGYNEDDGAFITRPVNFLLSLTNADGSIGRRSDNLPLTTALAVSALQATHNPNHQATIKAAQQFLLSQSTTLDAVNKGFLNVGGQHPTSRTITDLNDLVLVAEALNLSGLAGDASFWEATTMACQQSLQQFEKPANQSGEPDTNLALSLPHLIVLGLTYAGAGNETASLKQALIQVDKYYQPEALGQPEISPEFNLLNVATKSLRASRQPAVKSTTGESHIWRTDLINVLLEQYNADGSFTPASEEYLKEPNRILATAWAINTLNQIVHSFRDK